MATQELEWIINAVRPEDYDPEQTITPSTENGLASIQPMSREQYQAWFNGFAVGAVHRPCETSPTVEELEQMGLVGLYRPKDARRELLKALWELNAAEKVSGVACIAEDDTCGVWASWEEFGIPHTAEFEQVVTDAQCVDGIYYTEWDAETDRCGNCDRPETLGAWVHVSIGTGDLEW